MNKKMVKVQEGFNVQPNYVVTPLPIDITLNNTNSMFYYSGNIYVPVGANIYKITPDNSTATLIATNPAGDSLIAVAIDASGYIYASNKNSIFKSSAPGNPGNGPLVRYAGIGGTNGSGLINGPLVSAKFNTITVMVFDSNSDMFIADTYNTCIRKITTATGQVTTFAGSTAGFANGTGTAAKFSYLRGLTIDSSNNLYVTDIDNTLVRKITPSGVVSTHAGKLPLPIDSSITGSGVGFSGLDWFWRNGVRVNPNGFTSLMHISIDSAGHLYVADSTKIRRLITTIYTSGRTTVPVVSVYTNDINLTVGGITTDPSGVVYFISNGKLYKSILSCSAGLKKEGIWCKICPEGTWADSNATSCTPCPENLSTTPAIRSSSNNCIIVTAGYYLSGGNALACPSNATCVGGLRGSFRCSKAYGKNSASNACDLCDVGTYSPSGTCTPCRENTTTASTGSSSSDQCVASKGYYTSGTGVRECQSPLTTPSIGGIESWSCTLLRPGFYMNGPNITSCPSNATCLGGPLNNTTTFTCIDGHKKHSLGTYCEKCGIGFYGTGGTCSNACPTNTTTSSTGNSNVSQCTSAVRGYYMSGGAPMMCPSNAFCSGGTDSFTCSNGYMKNAAGTGCEECGIGFYGIGGTCTVCPVGRTTPSTGSSNSNQCTSVSPGYYMSNTTVVQCPSNSSCPGGPGATTTSFSCMDGYQRSGTTCAACLIGSYGSNGACLPCSNLAPSDTTATWTTLATAQTSCISATCKPNFKLNALSNNCEPCPSNTGGLNCASASPGYYMRGANPLPCPSNARCEGGSNSFACDNKFMINEAGDGCMPCPEGKGGPICTEALPGYYLNEAGILGSCPSNATCSGGTGLYTCSNGYFVNYRNGTCDVVTTIVQPGSSQLLNTRGTPTIAETTACTPRECTILFKDPVTGDMLPRNPCISQGDYYNFATKKCINKCCLISLETAKNDTKCKTDVITTGAIRKPGLCPANSRNLCCRGNYVATNTSCRNFWNPGVDAWSSERNARCAAGFSDYGIDSISEKRRKYLAVT